MGVKTICKTAGVRVLEKDVQAQLFAWIDLQFVCVDGLPRKLAGFVFAVPNGTQLAGSASQRARYMASLKRQGLRPGVSDIVIALPRGPYHGAFIELKKDPKQVRRATDEQEQFQALMAQVGYFTRIVGGFDDAQAAVREYLAS